MYEMTYDDWEDKRAQENEVEDEDFEGEDAARHAEYLRDIKPVDDVWPSDGPLADVPF